jgi:Arc/MetJ-type ribon-helix-helix transcriptional regulator
MQISLTPEAEGLIEEIMQSGTYENLDDAMTAALEMLGASLREKSKQFDIELQKGIEQIEREETVPYDLGKIKALATERIHQNLGYTREDSAALPSVAS